MPRRKASEETIAFLKKKIKAAAYTPEGIDIPQLFDAIDADGGGELDFEEFVQVMRTKGKLAVALASREDLRDIFELVDADGGGLIDVEEFEAFVMGRPVADDSEERIRAKDPQVEEADGAVKAAADKVTAADSMLADAKEARSAASERVESARAGLADAKAQAKQAIADAELTLEKASKKEKEEFQEALDRVRAHHKQPVEQCEEELVRLKVELEGVSKRVSECMEAKSQCVQEKRNCEQALKDRIKETVKEKYRLARLQFFSADNDKNALLMLQQVELLNEGPYGESSRLIPKLQRTIKNRIHFRKTGEKPQRPVQKSVTVGPWLREQMHNVYTKKAVHHDRQVKRDVKNMRNKWEAACASCKTAADILDGLEKQLDVKQSELEEMVSQKTQELEAAGKKGAAAVEEAWAEKIPNAEAAIEELKAGIERQKDQIQQVEAREKDFAGELKGLEAQEHESTSLRKEREGTLEGRIRMLDTERREGPKPRALLGGGGLWPRLSSAAQWDAVQPKRRAGVNTRPQTAKERRDSRQSWVSGAPQLDFMRVLHENEDTNLRTTWMKQQLDQGPAVWKPTRPSTAQQHRKRPTQIKTSKSVEQSDSEVVVRRPVSPKIMSVVMGGRPRSAHPRLKYRPESPQEILGASPKQRPQTAQPTGTRRKGSVQFDR